jgi:hypothetical protein
MGALFDYFAAASDDEAADVVGRVGGPGSPASIVLAPAAEPRRRLFGRKPPTPPEWGIDPNLPLYDVVSAPFDPVVQLGSLEELLTGTPYEEVVADPRSGREVARDGSDRLVLTVTDGLTEALANASDERLRVVALPWSQTEEFLGDGGLEALAGLLLELAALARQALGDGERLYCWLSV